MKKFDVIVIGTGASGATVAYESKKAGLDVAVVDNHPFGGTCALRGCDPKKVLVAAGEAIDWNVRMKGNGISYTNMRIDWQALMRVKKSFIDKVPERVENGFQQAGIESFHGTARFVNKTTLKVNDTLLQANTIVIAAGASPQPLGIPGEEYITISDQFLELTQLPKRIVFIGGGYISFEFAHIAARAGSQVTILHRSGHVLNGFDPDLVALLVKASKDIGIDIQVNAPVAAVEKGKKGFVVHAGKNSCTADLVVHGAGRIPDLAALSLETADVAHDKKGVTVNQYLQSTTNPQIYACGDATATNPPLTPIAWREGLVVGHNITHKDKIKAEFKAVPSVVFTVPPLASVGMSEAQIKDKNIPYKVKFEETASWYNSRRIHEKYSGYKTLVDKKTNRILGAHLLGHNADEVINLFALAMLHNLTADEVSGMIYSYPTHSYGLTYML